VWVRKAFRRAAAKQFGYSGASIARYLGVTASLVNRYASLKKTSMNEVI
jgi:predicted transcriptional regulator